MRIRPQIVVLYASPRDHAAVQPVFDVLTRFGVAFDRRVLSAHRTQHELIAAVDEITAEGPALFICAAGLAAHLAGLVAGRCIRPVIGLPLSRGSLNGLDALLATVQMPAGVPVATVGIDAAENAAYLALQIAGLYDDSVAEALTRQRSKVVSEYIDSYSDGHGA